MKKILLEKLSPYHQEQILAHWEKLTESQRNHLASQINALDLSLITRLYENHDALVDTASFVARAKEPVAFLMEGESNNISRSDAIKVGKAALSSGKVAALLVAGGQGTRLGFEHPKGMYPIGPVSNATLFQIHIEKTIAKSRQYGKPFPFCVMTSPATHAETVEFLEKNNRFGLDANDLYLFCQGTMPAISLEDGKLILSAPDELALSPDGHGGMLKGIKKSGILEKLVVRGVEQLFYFQVDNPLVDIGNEEFLGYHLLSRSELTSQVVRKQTPADRVGNVVDINGRLHVIEYSDLPNDVAERRKPDGTLDIWAGSIAVHLMDLTFLQTQTATSDSLPFHVAKKKVPFVDASGVLQNPSEPNAIKFERFIFDLLPAAKNAIVVEVDSSRHFAPLKNASGAIFDSPETVKKQCSNFYADWLTKAGAKVSPNVVVEISPLFANSPEELATKIAPGTIVDQNKYYCY